MLLCPSIIIHSASLVHAHNAWDNGNAECNYSWQLKLNVSVDYLIWRATSSLSAFGNLQSSFYSNQICMIHYGCSLICSGGNHYCTMGKWKWSESLKVIKVLIISRKWRELKWQYYPFWPKARVEVAESLYINWMCNLFNNVLTTPMP